MSFSGEPIVKDFYASLPKIELHAHLNGSISEETLKKLGCDTMSISEYQKLTTMMNKSKRTLDDCFTLFQIAHKATSNPDSLYVATQSVIEDFKHDNVIYLELRTTPRAEESMSKEQYIETVVRAIKNDTSGIMVKLILSIDRKDDDSAQLDSLGIILQMKEKYPDIIKGIDLSGNPKVGRFNEELFEESRKNDLKTAIHCAEVENETEVQTILNFHPDRIGHGTCLHVDYKGSQSIWELYCDKRIPIECCLTSNVLCGTSKSYQDHHVREWIKNDLPFTISTDDKGVFCTTLSREYELIQNTFNISNSDLWKISKNSVDYSFASVEEKGELFTILENWRKNNFKFFQ